MKRIRAALHKRLRDTVARWIALTIVLAMLTALALNALFVQLAGVWAYPPLTETGLLERIAAITRLIEASEPNQRPRLAMAAGDATYRVSWSPAREGLDAPPLDESQAAELAVDEGSLLLRSMLRLPYTHIEAYEPSEWPNADGRYALLIQLLDGSWLMFSSASRSWGLEEAPRSLIVLALVLVSVSLVALIATRRLARPLLRFTEGARRFAVDFNAPPIEPLGPHEIRQAILAFNAMQAQLQHFIKDRTQMLAAISHDLRTPLTRMRLRGEFIDDPEQQQRLFRDVDEMQAMISSALEFFRDDARLEPVTVFDLAELLQTLVDDYRDHAIDIAFNGPSRLVYVGRPQGLKRVMTNLLDNAVKYASEPAIQLELEQTKLCLRVLDRGPGIAPQYQEQVFAPFFRLETSRNKSTGGVGLGLSSARAIVLEQGGTLTLHNRDGGGLEARVLLPVMKMADGVKP